MIDTTNPNNDECILKITDLQVQFQTDEGLVKAVDKVSFQVRIGEVYGVVGELGCGKSVTARSIMRLIDPPGHIVGGSILFDGKDLMDLPEPEMVKIRGGCISMIFQQPQSALNPVIKVGRHIAETLELHDNLTRDETWKRTIDLIKMVEIPDAERRARAYVHEYSGGMAQRAMIAIALSCNPRLLIADEPTTALDVTIQAQILSLINQLRAKTHTSVILISHDLGVISGMADRVAVMYAGQIVEETTKDTLFSQPLHPYTQGLIQSKPIIGHQQERLEVIPGQVPGLIDLPPGCHFAPRCKARKERQMTICTEMDPVLENIDKDHRIRCWLYLDSTSFQIPSPVLLGYPNFANHKAHETVSNIGNEAAQKQPASGSATSRELVRVCGLSKLFPIRGGGFQPSTGWVHAVNDVSFSIQEGQTLGMVGESGCGKTTLARTLIRQIPANSGAVYFRNQNLFIATPAELKELRCHMQYIFQNPYSSLNPRMKVGDIIAEGLVIQGMKNKEQRHAIVLDTIRKVGLSDQCLDQYPHQFSGGQRQRIGIARALALKPEFLICDEPVSALDVSVQSQVLNLLRDLQKEFKLTYLFISHDLNVVEHLSDQVAVMYLGRLVELADRRELYHMPLHPYTHALLSAIPVPGSNTFQKASIQGDIPSPSNPPPGCYFQPRCPIAEADCSKDTPFLKEVKPGHWAACFLA